MIARPSFGVTDAERQARAALAAGRAVLLHILDCSKTGLAGVSRQAARHIQALDPNRVFVLVDACQLRCEASQVRSDLADGFAVAITGSKFANGPAFCGALLAPRSWRDRLGGSPRLPVGARAYSALSDWPCDLRCGLAGRLAAVNLGLILRWSAALTEIETYQGVAPATRRRVAAYFAERVRGYARTTPGVTFAGEPDGAPTIASLRCERSPEALAAIWRRLGEGQDGQRPCHLGQPVSLGGSTVLRACASMPMIAGVAYRLAARTPIEAAFATIDADLNEAFGRLGQALRI